MGTWAVGSFGNDTALDFAADLKDFAAVRGLLVRVEQSTTPLGADAAQTALAACEIVAAAMGRLAADLPTIPDFGSEAVPDALLSSARTTIQNIREASELAELWGDDDSDLAAWHQELDRLLARLDPAQAYAPPKKVNAETLPEDFLGYCYICYGMVTQRDGIHFEYDDPEGGSAANFPHRKCIEDQITEPGPYWHDDGSPTPVMHKQLMRGLGYDV